jgi:hypothetical protein
LGRLKKPPVLPSAAFHLPPCDFDIVFVLQPGLTVAPRGGCNFYSCNFLAIGLSRGQTCIDCLYLVGSPEDELQLWLRLSLVPGQTRPCACQKSSAFVSPSAAESAAPGVAPIIIVPNIRRGGHLRYQVPARGVAKHHNQICILLRTWVWGAR